MNYKKVKDGIFYNEKMGRIVEHNGYSTRIFWSTQMLDYLKRHYATTLNDELAGCLGVSRSSLIRKAHELGLKKDAAWLKGINHEHGIMAYVESKRLGNPGAFKKGERRSPETEFKKGRTVSEEMRAKMSEGVRKYNRRHPLELKLRAKKIWETRRANQIQKNIGI